MSFTKKNISIIMFFIIFFAHSFAYYSVNYLTKERTLEKIKYLSEKNDNECKELKNLKLKNNCFINLDLKKEFNKNKKYYKDLINSDILTKNFLFLTKKDILQFNENFFNYFIYLEEFKNHKKNQNIDEEEQFKNNINNLKEVKDLSAKTIDIINIIHLSIHPFFPTTIFLLFFFIFSYLKKRKNNK